MTGFVDPDHPQETVYRPILRARRGELDALRHLDAGWIPSVTPILVAQSTPRGPVQDAYDFFKAVGDRLPRGLRIGVDLADLPDPDGGLSYPARDVAEYLAGWGIPMLPVLRVTDSARRLTAYGDAARMHDRRAILRLRPDEAPGPATATRACDRVWRRTGLLPERCDLVIDLGALTHPGDLPGAEHTVRRVLGWAIGERWRSVTVAAGAMPPTLSHLPRNVATRLPRWEAELWRRIRHLPVGFGDHGVTAPRPGGRDHPARPLPTMRYTTRDAWWIYRWSRHTGGRPDDRFYDLCGRLTSAPHWAGAALSWGDREIARRARRTPGPGTPTSWIAWATSHHLAYVLSALTGTGSEPDADPTGAPPPDHPAGQPAGRSPARPAGRFRPPGGRFSPPLGQLDEPR
ncbi:beta family protein [Polymorphospora rubra]|uniref:Beta protein n=1 Tax=Polymorphospora rubra TaxID=338584 RepID=A0A810MUN6_9ACTN|nr:beta family protein [Polymorphospora rubra]BCJ64240.1 hypothetical protein Prubr_12610 [Polymorphospora rubra]